MSEPITVAEAASYLKLDTSSSPIEEQELVSSMITAARQSVEEFTHRTVTQRTRTLVLDNFATVIDLPYGDVISIESITYIDENGDNQTVDEYNLSKNRLTASYSSTWPDSRNQLGAVTIEYIAGYETVPETIRQAMFLLISDMYENRTAVIVGTIAQENPTVSRLLIPYRINMGI